MRNIEALREERRFLKEELKDLTRKIEDMLKDDIIEDVNISLGYNNSLYIEIKPKSAWSRVITLYLTNKGFEFKTSSGGWNDEQQALYEMNYITSKLIEFIEKNNYKEMVKHLYAIDLKINKLNIEINKLEKEKIKKELTKDLIKIDEDLVIKILDYVRNIGDVRVHQVFGSRLDSCLIEYIGNYYKLCKERSSKKYIKDILVRDFYITEIELKLLEKVS